MVSSSNRNVKLIALLALLVALLGMVYTIERTARPPSERIGGPQATNVDND